MLSEKLHRKFVDNSKKKNNTGVNEVLKKLTLFKKMET